MIEGLRAEIGQLTPELIAWRRDFHRHPELGFKELRTSAVVRGFLESLGLSVAGLAGTGLRAVVEGRPGGPTVALRADMDALPIHEVGAKEYLSENPGVAHCCGHDGHMAVLMAVARLLAARRERFKGNVVLLFQPAEEIVPGGAPRMIEEGALAGVDAIFGLHFWQPMATGTVGVVKGPMMANVDNFEIRIKGRGGAGYLPHLCIDP
ncbi:MAG: amidohydrolase, partial [Acidobacteriota bacterium]